MVLRMGNDPIASRLSGERSTTELPEDIDPELESNQTSSVFRVRSWLRFQTLVLQVLPPL